MACRPDQRQAIIWTNAGILLIGTLGTNFNENLIEIHAFSLKNIRLKMASGKWRPFCLGLNVLILVSRRDWWQQPTYWLKRYMNHSAHDDIMIWKYFLHHWPFVQGIHQALMSLLLVCLKKSSGLWFEMLWHVTVMRSGKVTHQWNPIAINIYSIWLTGYLRILL